MSDSRQPAAIGPAGETAPAVSADGSAAAESAAAPIDSWKVTLPCTRAEAEAIDAADDLAIDAVLMTSETAEDDRDHWRLDAYIEDEPGPAMLAAIRALVPSAADVAPTVEALTAEDWVTLSQAGLEPIREGRFVVHTAAHADAAPAGATAFLIEAGQAFGTGHHATTAGCLAMLDGLAGTFANVIDLGTGTGLLAFAARRLWPDARVMATDIDPVAVEVTRDNAALNRVADVVLVVADGARDPAIAAAAPYDLVIANILAGPLIAMAAEVAAIAAPGGRVLLAGLLSTQADAVLAAYAALGCGERRRLVRGDWTVLLLEVGVQPPGASEPLGDRDAWATDS